MVSTTRCTISLPAARRQLFAQCHLRAGHQSRHQHGKRTERSKPCHSSASGRSGARRAKVRKKSAALLQVINIYSPKNTFDSVYLSNYATINIIDPLARIKRCGSGHLVRATRLFVANLA